MKEVAIAILHQRGRYLMQLRDDIPGIVYPGEWTFFGGHVEPGEDIEQAIFRELYEEIRYVPPSVKLFAREVYPDFIRNVFHAPLVVELEALQQCEGWDMALWTPEEVREGKRFSENARQVRAIGQPHQRVLLKYIEAVQSRTNC